MDVTFTSSWYDETAEKNAANALLNDGCSIISQHADSMGAPSACEKMLKSLTFHIMVQQKMLVQIHIWFLQELLATIF